MQIYLDKNKKEQKKKTITVKHNISKFKSSYFDFYDDIKTTPKQDW